MRKLLLKWSVSIWYRLNNGEWPPKDWGGFE